MRAKLTDEQREALMRDGCPVAIEDDQTHQLYFLVDQATLDTIQHDADRDAIRQGLADMEAGRIVTLDELDNRIRSTIRRPLSACGTRSPAAG
jgi:predicted transcriptional regulator